MSYALVPAATTAILKSLLENGLVEQSITAAIGSDAAVSGLPPDRFALDADDKSQVNLFLYQLSQKGLAPASAYGPQISSEAKSLEAKGAARRGRLPLTVEMQYLLTVSGAQDLQAEILLGTALDILRQTPSLSGSEAAQRLHAAGNAQSLAPPTRALLAAADLGTVLCQMKISLQVLTLQEMLNLWSIFQTPYRLSALYKVTVEMHSDWEAGELDQST